MQPGKLSFSMFSRFLSINPPEPELLFDVKREHKANSDYPEGYPSLHDFSHNNCFATYQSGNLKSPELYYNRWNFTAGRCEATQLATGVYHVTKLTPPTTNSFNSILFSCSVSSFKGVGNKFGIYVSKPEGRDFDSSALFYSGNDDTGERFFDQLVVEGMNIIDLSEVHENPNLFWRLKIPESFYNKDESGGLLYTETDFYVVFFPVLDESQCNGYGEYFLPKFNDNFWDIELASSTISNNGLTLNNHGVNINSGKIVPYYDNGKICVISPMFFNFRIDDLEDEASSYLLFNCVDSEGTPVLEDETVNIHTTTLENNGSNISFYGYCLNHEEIFPEDLESVIAAGVHHNVGFYPPHNIITMLPYNNDRFTVHVSNDTNNYARLMVSDSEPFHDKSELQTLICKCKNTLSGSNSMLYKNEVQQPSQKIGLHGIRFATTSETVTDNSFKACLTDGGLATTEARKSIVSYLDGRVLETNDYGDYELLYKDIIMSVVLLKNEITDEDCVDTGSLLFATRDAVNCFSGQLYYLIAFKERLTPWQIAWALSHLV